MNTSRGSPRGVLQNREWGSKKKKKRTRGEVWIRFTSNASSWWRLIARRVNLHNQLFCFTEKCSLFGIAHFWTRFSGLHCIIAMWTHRIFFYKCKGNVIFFPFTWELTGNKPISNGTENQTSSLLQSSLPTFKWSFRQHLDRVETAHIYAHYCHGKVS